MKNLDGLITGPLHLEGTRESPEILAPLKAKNIKYMAQELGSGPLTLSLKREALENRILGQEDLVLSVSALLEDENSQSRWQAAFALDKKTVNIRAELSNFIFDSSKLNIENMRVGVKGLLNGTLSAEGPLDNLILNTEIASDDYTIFDPIKRVNSGQIQKDLGPATLIAVLKNGRIKFKRCRCLGSAKRGSVNKP